MPKVKVVEAYKNQYGYDGFNLTGNKYLVATITRTLTGISGSYTKTDTIAASNGTVTSTGWSGPVIFDYGVSEGYQAAGTYGDLTVSIGGDGSITKTLVNAAGVSGSTFTTTTALGSAYSLAACEGDCDALISAVDWTTLAWNTRTGAPGSNTDWATGLRSPTGYVPELFPGAESRLYPGGTPDWAFHVIAWSGYDTGVAGSPPIIVKAVAKIQTGGQYCVKTQPVNYEADGYTYSLGSIVCTNGDAVCSGIITVSPPAIALNQNNYSTFTPGGRC